MEELLALFEVPPDPARPEPEAELIDMLRPGLREPALPNDLEAFTPFFTTFLVLRVLDARPVLLLDLAIIPPVVSDFKKNNEICFLQTSRRVQT